MRHHTGTALSWSVADGIAEVTLHHGAANEIGTTMLADLELLADFVRNGAHGASAMILHSDRTRGFCAGADLTELYEGMQELGRHPLRTKARDLLGDRRADTLKSWFKASGGDRVTNPLIRRTVKGFLGRIHRVFDTLDTAPLTTISAVHGVVFGGGLELALTTDLIIADKSTRFAFPELRLGLVPGFGGIPRLERDLGNALVRDLLLTGRSLNARRAHEVGLVSQCVARGDALKAARAAAKQATRFDLATIRTAKAFAKKLPRARLDEEIETFLDLLRSPTVEASLERFVTSTDARPYLP